RVWRFRPGDHRTVFSQKPNNNASHSRDDVSASATKVMESRLNCACMLKPGGLEQFGAEVNPHVLREIRSWRGERELRPIVAALEAHTERKAFFDTYAEAMVARHLLARECDVRFEIRTPTGRTADFEVSRGDVKFYLHVKRIDTDRPVTKTLRIP